MKIWKVAEDVNNYSGFLLKNISDKVFLEENLDQGKLISNWKPIEVISNESDKKLGDCPHLWSGGYSLIISERAKKKISNKYREYIEFFPLYYKEKKETFYILNILNILDCIDYSKSKLDILMDKYIIDVKKYVFNEEIKNIPIFKIYLDGVIKISVFVNDEFKNLIEENKLEGFKFTEVFEFKE